MLGLHVLKYLQDPTKEELSLRDFKIAITDLKSSDIQLTDKAIDNLTKYMDKSKTGFIQIQNLQQFKADKCLMVSYGLC